MLKTPIDGAYQDLAHAIISRAAEDYRNALRGIDCEGCSPDEIIVEVEEFFHSNYFKILTKVNPDYIIRKIKEEIKERIMKVSLIQQTPNPIETISSIASICYDSNPKNPLSLVKHLYKNGHHSVFEHVYFTFKIEGISRACSHQLVRHRMCSFTQRSQRYCDEDGFNYVIPPTMSDSSFGNDMEDIKDWYKYYQEQNDVPNEDARYILPNACETSLYLSCNLRELIHIANERLCAKAQWEIRNLVRRMVSLVDPSLKFMLVPKCKSGRIICNSPCEVTQNE